MSKRYSILGCRYGERSEHTICECDTNPMPLAQIASMKRIPIGIVGKRMAYINKYEGVRVIDHAENKSWPVKD
jgi:hypothetical protein